MLQCRTCFIIVLLSVYTSVSGQLSSPIAHEGHVDAKSNKFLQRKAVMKEIEPDE